MLMEILVIDQDCLINHLNLYLDEIAEIILFSSLLYILFIAFIRNVGQFDRKLHRFWYFKFDLKSLGDLVSYRSHRRGY